VPERSRKSLSSRRVGTGRTAGAKVAVGDVIEPAETTEALRQPFASILTTTVAAAPPTF